MDEKTENSSENSSGLKDKAALPKELKGWNWGAFYLNWIWGIGNSTYLALLMFVPVVNVVLLFMLGAKGNEWAWKNRYWRDVDHFKTTQRKWAMAGFTVWLMAFGVIMLLLGFLKGKPYELSLAAVRANSEVVTLLGAPLKPGYFVLGEVDIPEAGKSGYAELYYVVKGSKGKGHVSMRAYIKNGRWELFQLMVESDSTGQKIIILTPKQMPKKTNEINASVSGSALGLNS